MFFLSLFPALKDFYLLKKQNYLFIQIRIDLIDWITHSPFSQGLVVESVELHAESDSIRLNRYRLDPYKTVKLDPLDL